MSPYAGGRWTWRVAVLLITLSSSALGDDRRLFRSTPSPPYVFFLLDASAGMRLRFDGTWAPAANDDPSSRMYQAKKALFEGVGEAGDSASFGWATLQVRNFEPVDKHWIYTLESEPSWLRDPAADRSGQSPRRGPPWNGSGTAAVAYPQPGQPLFFGEDGPQDAADLAGQPGDHTQGSCYLPERLGGDAGAAAAEGPPVEPAGSILAGWTDVEALARLWTFPKLGSRGVHASVQWFEHGGTTFELTWLPLGGGQRMGDASLDVTVRLRELLGADCSLPAFKTVAQEAVRLVPLYRFDQDGLPLEGSTRTLARHEGGGGLFRFEDYGFEDSCASDGAAWEPNDDDIGSPYSYDVQYDPLGRDPESAALGRGDRIPFDWINPGFSTGNRQELMLRLAPNLRGEALGPDFRIASYFEDPCGGDTGTSGRCPPGPLDLVVEATDSPPAVSAAGSPWAGALRDFERWYEDWSAIASSADRGDPGWSCREVHLVLITSGEESCLGDPPAAAADLARLGVKTWVLALGGPIDPLDSLAVAGGTCADRDGDGEGDDCAFVAASGSDMRASLRSIFESVGALPRSLRSAFVHPLESGDHDRSYISRFRPLDASVFPGEMHAFERPVPVDEDGNPDATVRCTDQRPTGCHLWEAQEVVTTNQVHATQPVGERSDQRRVFYSEAGSAGRVPLTRHYFRRPDESTPPEQVLDLYQGLGFEGAGVEAEAGDEVGARPALPGGILEEVGVIVERTLALKTARLPGGEGIQYILGDIFHSDPMLLGSPSHPAYLLRDAGGDSVGGACSLAADGDRGYRCFARKHVRRRRVLLYGSNDGMVHGLDAGFATGGVLAGGSGFDSGTGRELFAFMPRRVLPTVRKLAIETSRHRFTVDGPVVAADVFIDPLHEGTDSLHPPAKEDREWRTIIVGGLRRGGETSPDFDEPPTAVGPASGYYALDLTHPDPLDRVDVDGNGSVEFQPRIADRLTPPGCLGGGEGRDLSSDCGPVAYMSVLWEFSDSLFVGRRHEAATRKVRLDEDGNGLADLAGTWSTPNLGRIRVCTSATCIVDPADPAGLEDRFVAIFGGGLDPEAPHTRGNWLYMVDVETGRSIYKRRLEGAAPSAPAAVDTNGDGYLDRIYIGTTLGFLYRVDLVAEDGDGNFVAPRLMRVPISSGPSSSSDGVLVFEDRLVGQGLEPEVLFDATEGPGIRPGRSGLKASSMFFPPSVVRVGDLDALALAFGTGNREDLTDTGGRAGAFFVVVDEMSAREMHRPGFEPIRRDDLLLLDSPGRASGSPGDLLRPPGAKGWMLELAENERLVSAPVTVAGVTLFSTFQPNPPDSAGGDSCQSTGRGRSYAMQVIDGAGLVADREERSRFLEVEGLVGPPVLEPQRSRDLPPGAVPDGLSPGRLRVLQEIQASMPTDCRFNSSFRYNVSVRGVDSREHDLVAIPICIRTRDFREE